MTKSEVVEKIIASSEFQKDEIYRALLRYLYLQTESGAPPKEYSIAIDVLKKDKDFDPAEDTAVRYRIYKLRDKLERYYLTEGRNDTLQLSIPKGHYSVEFTHREIEDEQKDEARPSAFFHNRLVWGTGAVAAISIVVSLILLADYLRQPERLNYIDKDAPIWSTFFSNQLPLKIVIGDFTIFEEFDEELNHWRRIMDQEIRSDKQYEAYKEEHPERTTRRVYVGDVVLGEPPHNIVQNLLDFNNVLFSFEQYPALSWRTGFEFSELRDNNVVFLGDFANLGKLDKLLRSSGVHHSYTELHEINIEIIDTATVETPDTLHFKAHSGYPYDEGYILYGAIVVLPGFNNENYMIVAGYHYAAHIQLVKLISYPEGLGKLEEMIIDEHGSLPEYFVLLLEMTVFNNKTHKYEPAYFKEINKAEYVQRRIEHIREFKAVDIDSLLRQ